MKYALARKLDSDVRPLVGKSYDCGGEKWVLGALLYDSIEDLRATVLKVLPVLQREGFANVATCEVLERLGVVKVAKVKSVTRLAALEIVDDVATAS